MENVMVKSVVKKLSAGLLLSSLMLTAACTKKREAKLPADKAEGTFAIADLDISQNPDLIFSLTTGSEALPLGSPESLKAAYEIGVVPVDEDSVLVPEKMHYMFTNLEMAGQTNQTYQIAFTVDNKTITALKVVSGSDSLSRLEKQIALSLEDLHIQRKAPATRNSQKNSQLLEQRLEKMRRLEGRLFVPIFKFEVKSYGVLERVKNPLGEETSTLELKETEWSKATHIQISVNPDHRVMVHSDPGKTNEVDRVFVTDRINNKMATVEQINTLLDVAIKLAPSTPVLTQLDDKNLRIYEVSQKSKLMVPPTEQNNTPQAKANLAPSMECSAEVLGALPREAQEDCVLIQRFNVPVSYVKATIPTVDYYSGAHDKNVKFEEAASDDNTGLVKIAKNAKPEEVQAKESHQP